MSGKAAPIAQQSLRFAALSVGAGVSAGVTAALLRGPMLPSWGIVGAAFTLTAAIGAGSYFERQDGLTHFLRFLLAFILSFLCTTVPITISALPPPGPAAMESRELLATRWILGFVSPAVIAVTLLVARRRRGQAASPR